MLYLSTSFYFETVFTFVRVTHTSIDITALPAISDAVVRSALSGSKSDSSDTVDKLCDRFTGEDKMKAVICCTDCKKSFCHQHAEVKMRGRSCFHVSIHFPNRQPACWFYFVTGIKAVFSCIYSLLHSEILKWVLSFNECRT